MLAQKFNTHHDSNGRFASTSGGANHKNLTYDELKFIAQRKANCIVFPDDHPVMKSGALGLGAKHTKDSTRKLLLGTLVSEVSRLKSDLGIPKDAYPFAFGPRSPGPGMIGAVLHLRDDLPPAMFLSPHADAASAKYDDFKRTHPDVEFCTADAYRGKSREDMIKATVRHEYGHILTDDTVGRRVKEVISALPPEQKTVGYMAKHVSYYATTSPREMAAEVFSRYTDANYRRGTMPREFEGIAEFMIRRARETNRA